MPPAVTATQMQRDLGALDSTEFDLLVIGAGIYGASIARDAALRGLTCALLERGDFGSGTSANSFKMVHGGIRYLQHGDVYRVRQSSRERNALLRIAPHLIEPLPILIPTYGHGRAGRELLAAGLKLYELLTPDRNRGIRDPDRRIPAGRILSRTECVSRFPDLTRKGLTGGALFHDAQMYGAARLVVATVRSAAELGTVAANYVEVRALLRNGDRVVGVEGRDRLSGDTVRIRARLVINAAGAWAASSLNGTGEAYDDVQATYSRDAYLVVRREWRHGCGLAVTCGTQDPDALMSRGGRHLFIVPWRDRTLVGVWHRVHKGSTNETGVSDLDVRRFIGELNEAYPAFALTPDDVCMRHGGLVLFGENRPGAVHLRYGHRSRIIDHAAEHGIEGLITVMGVRATTARGVADRVVRLAGAKRGLFLPRCSTARTPIHGGEISSIGDFMRVSAADRPEGVSSRAISGLVRRYGSELRRVLAYVRDDPALARRLGSVCGGSTGDGADVIGAEVIHAIREEMAIALSDVVFRRTGLGTAGHPGQAALRECAALMAAELGWTEERMEREMRDTVAVFESVPRKTSPETVGTA